MNRGLTLIELVVSITMFSLTIGAVVGVFVSVIQGQNRSLASQELINQTSYVLEYTSRAIRMAKKDVDGTCTGTPYLNYVITASGDGGIKFRNYKDECQEFFLESNRLKEQKGDSPVVDLTSDEVEVLYFNIGPDDSWDQNDSEQPRVTLYFDVRSKASGLKTEEQPEIRIQTTVSQRNLDCYAE